MRTEPNSKCKNVSYSFVFCAAKLVILANETTTFGYRMGRIAQKYDERLNLWWNKWWNKQPFLLLNPVIKTMIFNYIKQNE